MKEVCIKSEQYHIVKVEDNLDKAEMIREAVRKIEEGVPSDNIGDHEHDYKLATRTLNKDVMFSGGEMEYQYTVGENEDTYCTELEQIKAWKDIATRYFLWCKKAMYRKITDEELEEMLKKEYQDTIAGIKKEEEELFANLTNQPS